MGQSGVCLNAIIECFSDEKVESGDQDLDVMIEWIYRIDLDKLLLTIKGYNAMKTYNILDISDDWLNDFEN